MSDIDFENWEMKKERLWGGVGDTEAALAEYAEVAAWCNEWGIYTITEDGDYYRVIKIEDQEILENLE